MINNYMFIYLFIINTKSNVQPQKLTEVKVIHVLYWGFSVQRL